MSEDLGSNKLQTQNSGGKKAKPSQTHVGNSNATNNSLDVSKLSSSGKEKPPRGDNKEKRPSQLSHPPISRLHQQSAVPASSAPPNKQHQLPQSQSGKASQSLIQTPTTRLALFDHLPRKVTAHHADLMEVDRTLHPATIKIGLMFSQGIIREDDDRVAALLATFCTIIEDYKTPTNKSLSWDLDKHIKIQVQHLVNCRQHSMGMGNLIKFLRLAVSRVPPDINESEAKSLLISQLHAFLEERILFSREAITQICTDSIRDGDVILTFGSSPLLRQVFRSAAKCKKFKLIVADARPLNDGLLTLLALSSFIPCVYTTLAGVATALEDATKVIVGASALLANGAMLAPAGTAMVSSLASRKNVPLIVACEGYKFCEKVQVDSIVYNELGNPAEIATASNAAASTDGSTPTSIGIPQRDSSYKGAAGPVAGLKADDHDQASLPFQVINLRYDLTPIKNISAVATETGLIPPTSIPVLMREFRADVSAPGGQSY